MPHKLKVFDFVVLSKGANDQALFLFSTLHVLEDALVELFVLYTLHVPNRDLFDLFILYVPATKLFLIVRNV